MRRARWWLLGAFSVVVAMIVIIVGLVGWRTLHYRLFHDDESLGSILRDAVHNGDPIEKVERLLEPGVTLRGRIRTHLGTSLARLPEGFEPSDVLVAYRGTGGYGWVLQFRRGRLINHTVGAPRWMVDPHHLAPGVP